MTTLIIAAVVCALGACVSKRYRHPLIVCCAIELMFLLLPDGVR